MRWSVLYKDGSTFTSEDGTPADAPGHFVVGVAQEAERTGMGPQFEAPYYVFDVEEFGGWRGLSESGFHQYMGVPGPKVVKLGYYVPTEAYREMVEQLRAGGLLPARSAHEPWEAR